MKIGQGRSVEISNGDDALTARTGNIAHTALQDIKVTSNAGNVKVTALQAIELVVGANTLKIEQTGISINGLQVKIDGSMMIDLKSELMTTLPGTMTEVKADAMMMLKGGIMMPN